MGKLRGSRIDSGSKVDGPCLKFGAEKFLENVCRHRRQEPLHRRYHRHLGFRKKIQDFFKWSVGTSERVAVLF